MGQAADKKKSDQGILINTAKAIGTVAGKISALAGATHAATPAGRPAVAARGKFPKKNKARLPRRQKKAQQKTKQRAAQADPA